MKFFDVERKLDVRHGEEIKVCEEKRANEHNSNVFRTFVAVEKVIGEHYQEQLELLGDDHKDLKKTISKFRDDELEHHDIGIEHDAESAPGYKIMSKVIELGCKTAIAISKKI